MIFWKRHIGGDVPFILPKINKKSVRFEKVL